MHFHDKSVQKLKHLAVVCMCTSSALQYRATLSGNFYGRDMDLTWLILHSVLTTLLAAKGKIRQVIDTAS